jgi:glycosyltransferase involved in cell wall biosynthesis
MRLCYIANPFSIHSQRWVSFFARQGHEVHLIDFRSPGRAPAPSIEGVTIHEIKWKSLPLPWGRELSRYLPGVLRVRSILKRLKPQLLHVHYIDSHAWIAALTGFRPLVLTAWGGDILAEQGAFDTLLQRLLTPSTIRSSTLLTADATPLIDVLGRYRRHSSRIQLIRFAPDRERFYPMPPNSNLRKALDLGDGPVVFSPRSFKPVYRIETIVRAWPEVVAQIPDARLLLKSYFAEAEYTSKLHKLVSDLDITSSVRFAGETDYEALPAYYNLASVTVSVPYSDGLPATALEALACGSALVVSDLSWTRGTITHEQNGMLVPLDDPGALSAVLLRLLRDHSLRRRIITGGLAFIAEFGDWQDEMCRMQRAYELVIRNSVSRNQICLGVQE